MRAIFKLADCELRRAMGSSLVWMLGAAVFVLVSLLFFLRLTEAQQLGGGQSLSHVHLRHLYSSTTMLLAFVAPVLTMHLLSDEQRSGALDLLIAAPLSCTTIVFGKFLGGSGLLAFPILLVSLIPAAMLPFTTLDMGMVALYFGVTLLHAGLLGAIGLYVSSLWERPAVAAMTCFLVIFLLWLCGLSGYFMAPDEPLTQVLSYLYLMGHYQAIQSGWFSTADVGYYVLLTGLCIGLTVQRLERRRILP